MVGGGNTDGKPDESGSLGLALGITAILGAGIGAGALTTSKKSKCVIF